MLNKVTLIGRLGRDPEVRYMPNGKAVVNLGLATSETWKDQSGQKQENTEWHNLVMYERLAEIAGEYLKKGSQIYVEGRIKSRKYTDKNNIERTAYEIIVSEMKMLDTKSSQASSENYGNYGAYQSPKSSQNNNYNNNYQEESNTYNNDNNEPPSAPQARQKKPSAPVAPAKPVENIDDDIPF